HAPADAKSSSDSALWPAPASNLGSPAHGVDAPVSTLSYIPSGGACAAASQSIAAAATLIRVKRDERDERERGIKPSWAAPS
ncbi:hypothetical protein CDV36_011247, partial [Fusarium kuroshium]